MTPRKRKETTVVRTTVVKVQLPLFGGGDAFVCDKDRAIVFMKDPYELTELMDGRVKAYFKADVLSNGAVCLTGHEEDQPW